MLLDLRTIYLLTGVTAIVLGLIQYFASHVADEPAWLRGSGVSLLLLGTGMVLGASRDYLPFALTTPVGNAATVLGYLLLLASMRSLARSEPRWLAHGVVAVGLVVLLTWVYPEADDFATRIAVVSVLCALCDAWIAFLGWRIYRRERLITARMVGACFTLTALLLLVRAGLAAFSQAGPTLFAQASTPFYWLSLMAAPIVTLRAMLLVLLAHERSQRAWEALAHRDALTGANNRLGLRKAFNRDRRRHALAHGRSLLLIDADRLKQLNDSHGHAAGDQMLRTLVRVATDSAPADATVARLGGDEFAVLLPGQDLDAAARVAHAIRQSFHDWAARTYPHTLPTVSVGMAHCTDSRTTKADLLARADTALYAAKQAGRNRVFGVAEKDVREWPAQATPGAAQAPLR